MLTANANKARLYDREAAFRTTLERLRSAVGQGLSTTLRRLSYVLVKPDGVAGRKGAILLRFVRAHGFSPIAVERARLDPNVMHTLWRYQWNCATVDRTRLSTLMGSSSESLLVLLWDTQPARALPASVHLWGLKGAADTRAQRPEQLRAQLGVTDRFFGYGHLPDEPADVVRELGILLDGDRLCDLTWRADRTAGVEAHADATLAQLEADVEPIQVNDANAISCLRSRLARQALAPALASLVAGCVTPGEKGTWSLANVSDASFFLSGPRRFDWDLAIAAAARVRDNVEGVEPLLSSGIAGCAAHLWSQRESPAEL